MEQVLSKVTLLRKYIGFPFSPFLWPVYFESIYYFHNTTTVGRVLPEGEEDSFFEQRL